MRFVFPPRVQVAFADVALAPGMVVAGVNGAVTVLFLAVMVPLWFAVSLVGGAETLSAAEAPVVVAFNPHPLL